MLYTFTHLAQSALESLLFWVFALSPVIVFWQLLAWAGQHLTPVM
ncbi:hypothetical protein [Hydrogenophaga sp. RWCD_12]